MAHYLEVLTSYLCDSSFDDFPQHVVKRAKEVLADGIAVIAAGAQEEEVKKLVKILVRPQPEPAATVLGAGVRADALNASLINGTAGTFLELDEGNQFARGHPSIHVIPAALAMAEEKRLSGKEFLCALILGYEVGARIGIACKLSMSMHPHGTWGTVGAAVAVGKLMGYQQLDMRQIINVSSSLGLATSRRTMLEGGTVRNVYAGVSGYMGVLAHNLVKSGFTGEADGLSTVFGSVVSDTFSPDAMIEDLGSRFEIARNYFKRHACCRYNHGSLDALEQILSKRPDILTSLDQIDKIEVKTYSLAAQLSNREPDNSLAAKFSVPFAISTYLVHGHAGVESFKTDAVNDPEVRTLAKKVEVSEDPALTSMMPDKRPSRVRIILSSGEELEAEAFVNKGDFEDPYTPKDLEDKFYELAGPVWGEKVAQEMHARIKAFDEMEDVNEMTRLAASP